MDLNDAPRSDPQNMITSSVSGEEMSPDELAVTSMLAVDSATTTAVQHTEMPSSCVAPVSHPNNTASNQQSENNPPPAVGVLQPESQCGSTSQHISRNTQMAPPETPVADMAKCGHADKTEDGSEEDDNPDDDMSSDISEGVDLQEELQEALDDNNFEFRGSFYHGSLLANTPNPCLFISGLGLVGLPLSDRDAKSIISCSSMAPFGQGERLVVDKDVRDTWEIEASRISFGNVAWQDYVNKTLCSQLCASLGINIGANPPRMELYKLLLYETDSHFLPHQDTQKADGMFATAIIILPSAYTGGQVVLSHASTSKTIDFANDSLFSMALLAWYTDVKHEVKPVTSGYRLALSYNLIHVAPPGIPTPCLPEMQDATDLLRRVLRKWRDDKYETSPNFMAYLLDHQYSAANLRQGLKGLKGADLHRMSFLRPIVEELGFMVGLAELEHNVSGQAEDGGYNYRRSGRYRCYYDESDEEEEEEDTPDMCEVDSRTTTISGLVNLDGSTMLSVGKVEVEAECLIPNDPFEDQTPDEADYEGYQGNYPGQVEHWYRRSVLVLMHEDRVDDVCFSVDGAAYAFRKLQQSTTIPPTADDRRWANRLLQARNLTKQHVLALFDFILKWKDLPMWKAITSNPACILSGVDSTILFKAMEIFAFDATRLSFETLLARSTVLTEKLDFLSQIPLKASSSEKEAVIAWYQREVVKVLSSYKPTNAQDIPTIMMIIRLFGLKAFENIVMPIVTKNKGNYGFCIAFMKSLSQNRETIVQQEASRSSPEGINPPPPPTPTEAIDTLIKQCLKAALSRWNDASPAYYSHPYYGRPAGIPSVKVERIIEIIEQAITFSDLDTCKTLFIELLKGPDTTQKKFPEIYLPLIPRLRTLLTTKNLQLFQAPFIDFLQLIIGLYLRDILGKKGQLSNLHLRKIGCGCGDCKALDDFIFGLTRSTTTIRIVQVRRVHLERQAAAARDLCTYQIIRNGSPHGIELKKLPSIIEASTWLARQKAAKSFLASIGSDADISRIMGNRYVDLKHALDGTRAFGSSSAAAGAHVPSAAANTGSVPAPSTAVKTNTAAATNLVQRSAPLANRTMHPQLAVPSSSTVPNRQPTSAAPTKVAGQKRKTQPKAHLGTIDLTEEDF